MSLVIFVIPVLQSYLLKHGTTWNLKQPTRSKKQSETTWNNLQQARNNLKRPTMSKWLEATYNKQEMTWKEQILKSWNPSTWKIINWRAAMSERSNRLIPCLQYFVSSLHMQNECREKNQSKCQNKTKRKEKTSNNYLTS